jgi:hypothetical protein
VIQAIRELQPIGKRSANNHPTAGTRSNMIVLPDISLQGPAALILGGLTFLVLAAVGRVKRRSLPVWLRWMVGVTSAACILLGLVRAALDLFNLP